MSAAGENYKAKATFMTFIQVSTNLKVNEDVSRKNTVKCNTKITEL